MVINAEGDGVVVGGLATTENVSKSFPTHKKGRSGRVGTFFAGSELAKVLRMNAGQRRPASSFTLAIAIRSTLYLYPGMPWLGGRR
ncbi:hypothetical protein D3C75_1281860 [compost metagenome]